MSEKKVGKRLLTWVLVLVMTLSLLPLNVLADEAGETQDVIQGYYDQNGGLLAQTVQICLMALIPSTRPLSVSATTPMRSRCKLC